MLALNRWCSLIVIVPLMLNSISRCVSSWLNQRSYRVKATSQSVAMDAWQQTRVLSVCVRRDRYCRRRDTPAPVRTVTHLIQWRHSNLSYIQNCMQLFMCGTLMYSFLVSVFSYLRWKWTMCILFTDNAEKTDLDADCCTKDSSVREPCTHIEMLTICHPKKSYLVGFITLVNEVTFGNTSKRISNKTIALSHLKIRF